MNARVAFAGRARHQRDPGIEQVFAGQFEIRMPAAEHLAEEFAEPLVDRIERLLEARPSFTIDV